MRESGGNHPWLRSRMRTRVGAAIVLSSIALSGASQAKSEDAKRRAEQMVTEVETGVRSIGSGPVRTAERRPEALVVAAELHLRTGQYDAAIDKLNIVVELAERGKASQATRAEAVYFLAEAYFQDEQLYSARRRFEEITDPESDPAFASFGGRAASRLVDVALRTERADTLADVLVRVDRMIARERTPELLYARSKALFAMGRYADAHAQAGEVSGNGLVALRAAYLRGVALMRRTQADAAPAASAAVEAAPDGVDAALPAPPQPGARAATEKRIDFTAAVAEFSRAAAIEGDGSAASQKIRDLSLMAVGRLEFEAGRFLRAAAAYQKVPRRSEHFAEALFELAWTYVRMGDYDRSQRALDVLRVLDPGLIDGADAALLRADLMLRAGKFREAERAYDEARATYDPLRREVDDYLSENEDPGVFYDNLTASDLEMGHQLPTLVIDWAREEAREERLFAIIDEVAQSRDLVKRSRRIVTLLRATLNSPSRAKVFPELLVKFEDTVGLMNQLAIARLALARGMDEEAGTGSAELEKVRADRRQLMQRLGRVPTTRGDFSVRDAQAETRWNEVSQKLQRLQLEADHLQALVNGLRRIVVEGDRFGVKADPATRDRFQEEIAESERALLSYRAQIQTFRDQVQMGRAQAGLGDERFEEDDRVRESFARLFSQEVLLSAGGQDKDADAVAYAKGISPLLARVQKLEATLASRRSELDREAMSRGTEMMASVQVESEAIERHAAELDTLDDSARVLVGTVARDNFVRVRDRLRGVVMRADVGLVQKSWEVRELQQSRVRELLRERAREERIINDELREVLDDAGDDQ